MTLSTPRVYPSVATISQCLIVIGGRRSSKELNTVEVVDTKRNATWNLGANMNQPRCGCAAVAVGASRVMAIGGDGSNGTTAEVLQLKLLDYETLIGAVEKELRQVKRESSFFNKRKSKSQRAILKAYLRDLKRKYDDYASSSSWSSQDDGDDIARTFSDELPFYDNGRIVAKKELKESGQARVYKGIMKDKDGNSKPVDVAIKVFKSKRDWDDCKQELITLLKISGHANVMEVLDFWEVPMPAFCMRYVKGGDLRDHLDKKGKITGKNAVKLLQGIAEGLRHLHSNGIVHRDLKSPNILLEKKGNTMNPVVIDLGLGKSAVNSTEDIYQTKGLKGTAHWMAPEMITDRKWSNKSDMFALGVIMWEILTGESPYPGMRFMQILAYVQNKQGRPDYAGQMQKARVSQTHQALVKRLWHTDPSKRPSADEFLKQLH
jgi:serine/threonine protein kinase